MQQVGKKSPIGLVIGLVVIVLLAAFAFRSCSPAANNTGTTGTGNQNAQEGQLGQPFAALSVDSNGCPDQTTTVFRSDDTIFAGFERSEIPSGTNLFARLSLDGQVLEDTDEITADQDISSCVWFEFQPTGSQGFEPGSYTVDFFINGNSAEQVRFEVEDDGAGGQNSLGAIELGSVTTTSGVDRAGCPIDSEDRFRSDDEVFVAYERSLIPAGTQLYARLVYQNQVIEETQPISAESDMDTCVWFVFENTRGLDAGNYEAEVVVNGSVADRLDFQVD